MAHLQDGSLEGGNGTQHTIVTGVDAIESQSQTTHIELSFGEMLDASRVIHMTQDFMTEGILQLLTGTIEFLKLHA